MILSVEKTAKWSSNAVSLTILKNMSVNSIPGMMRQNPELIMDHIIMLIAR